MNRKLHYTTAFLCLLAVLLCGGCTERYSTPEELSARVRRELPGMRAAETELRYAGMVGRDGMALLWYICGSAEDGYNYIAAECSLVGEVEYEFVRIYEGMDRGPDIAVLQWRGGYAFCIHNPACRIVRITDSMGTYSVPVDAASLPYVFYSKLLPTEYVFLDVAGKEIC